MTDSLYLDPIGYFSQHPESRQLPEKITPPFFKGSRYDSLLLQNDFGPEIPSLDRDDTSEILESIDWDKVDKESRGRADNSELLATSIFGNRASLKLAAIQEVYGIFEPKMSRYADIAGGPGSWTQYMQRKFPNCQGFGISLKSEEFDWKVSFYNIDTRRFFITYGLDETGNIYKKSNRDEFAKTVLRAEFGDYGMDPDLEASEKLIDLCICDGGIGDGEIRGGSFFKLFLAEIVTSLRCLGDGGSLVIKLFQLDYELIRQTIFVLSTLFERITLYKPITSRSTSREKYLLAVHLIPEVGKPAFQFFEKMFERINNNEWPQEIVTKDENYTKYESWIDSIHARMESDRRQAVIRLKDVTEGRKFTPQVYDLFEVYRLLGVPTVDKTISIRPYGRETNLVGSASISTPFGEEPVVPLIPFRETVDDAIVGIFDNYEWPQNCNPIPTSDFDVSDPDLANKIVQVFRSINLEFPYIKNFRTLEDFNQAFLQFAVQQQPLEILAKPLDVKVFGKTYPYSSPGNADQNLAFAKGDVNYDQQTLIGYFSDENRMLCAKGTAGENPWRRWNEYGNFTRDVVNRALENENLSLESLRDGIEPSSCQTIDPNFIKSILGFLGIKQKSNVLDTSFGWGEKLIATAGLKANYLGFASSEQETVSAKKMIDAILAVNSKLHLEVQQQQLPLANPESLKIKFDAILYSPDIKKDQLITKIYPTVDQLWSLIADNGYLVILASNIDDIVPFLNLDHPEGHFNGPIPLSTNPPSITQVYIWQKSFGDLTESQSRRLDDLTKTSKKYLKDNFEFTGPYDGQLLIHLDDFPYYTKYSGLKSASKMFATLKKTRANVESVTSPITTHIRGLLNNIKKYIDISQGQDEVAYLFSKLLNENLTRDQRFEMLKTELADFPRLPPVDAVKRAKSRVRELEKFISGSQTPGSVLDIGGDDGSVLRAFGDRYNISAEHRYLIDPAGKISDDYRLVAYTPEGDIPLPDASIDVIILLNSLHHIPNRPQLIREIGRILSLDGVVIVREHDDENYDKMFEKFIDILHESISAVGTSHNDSECYIFSRASLQRWMSKVGLGSELYINVGGPQELYYESYVRKTDFRVLDHKSRLSHGSTIVVRIWPDDYMKSDFASNWFTEQQRMTCSKGGLQSPIEYWNSLTTKERKAILAQGIPKANDTLYSMICTNFNPALYRELIIRSAADAGQPDIRRLRILDPSSGWGDRLIGALSLGVRIYLGVDPNPTLESAYKRIIETFSGGKDLSKRYQVLHEYFEKYDNPNFVNFFDITMTSPPYFTFEVYPGSIAPKSGEYQEWLDVMYRPYLHQAYRYTKEGGVLIFYVDDVPGGEFRQSTIDILDELAEQHLLIRLPTIGLRTDTNTGRKIVTGPGVRTALRWRKISSDAIP